MPGAGSLQPPASRAPRNRKGESTPERPHRLSATVQGAESGNGAALARWLATEGRDSRQRQEEQARADAERRARVAANPRLDGSGLRNLEKRVDAAVERLIERHPPSGRAKRSRSGSTTLAPGPSIPALLERSASTAIASRRRPMARTESSSSARSTASPRPSGFTSNGRASKPSAQSCSSRPPLGSRSASTTCAGRSSRWRSPTAVPSRG